MSTGALQTPQATKDRPWGQGLEHLCWAGIRTGALGAQTSRVMPPKAALVSGDLPFLCWQKAPETRPYWGPSNPPACAHMHVPVHVPVCPACVLPANMLCMVDVCTTTHVCVCTHAHICMGKPRVRIRVHMYSCVPVCACPCGSVDMYDCVPVRAPMCVCLCGAGSPIPGLSRLAAAPVLGLPLTKRTSHVGPAFS